MMANILLIQLWWEETPPSPPPPPPHPTPNQTLVSRDSK